MSLGTVLDSRAVNAAIYCRISSDRFGAGVGVATQEADCRAHAQHLGHQVVAVCTDNDISAYSGKPRPGYAELLDLLRAGGADVVIAWHEDRLHRSPRELEDYIDICQPGSIPTLFVKAGELDLTTASGRMTARIRGAVARGEVEHMIERTRRAKLRAAENGEWKGGRRPFGYTNHGTEVVEAEADLIRRAVAQLLAGGSLRSITAEWNAAGVRTTMGNQWHDSAMRTTLLKPRNAGLMVHQGRIIGKGAWPAIIDPEQWQALVALMKDPGRRTNTGRPARRWLGTGLYRCGCGALVRCTSSNGRPAYRCVDGCRGMSKHQPSVDRYVSETVMGWLRAPENAQALARDGADPVARLEAEATGLRRRLNTLAGMCAAGQIDDEQLAEATRVINAELDGVRARIQDAYRDTVLEGIADADDPGLEWKRADLMRRRAVLDVICSVTLLPGGQGRPPGWRPGEPYFFPELVQIDWRR